MKALTRRLRCALTEHRWESSPTLKGYVVVLCLRCGELIVAPFVDAGDVLGLANVPGATQWLGDAAGGRLAVALVDAMTSVDQPAWKAAREAATARPGASIDSLARLASALALMPGNSAALRLFEVAHEVDLPRQKGTDDER